MPDAFHAALDLARERIAPAHWDQLSARERSRAIYHALCRIDSGCRRTGGPGDAALPPCPASAAYIAARGCMFAGTAASLPQITLSSPSWRTSSSDRPSSSR